jgi:hypothetical protein
MWMSGAACASLKSLHTPGRLVLVHVETRFQ